MAQSDLFKRLGAPLANSRWSWGAVRDDGTVFLRVWQDKYRKRDGISYIQVTHNDRHSEDPDELGHLERLRHVDLVRSGSPCFLVMCEAVNTTAVPRKVKSFNENEVFRGGALLEMDGDWWVELLGRVPVSTVKK